MRGIIAFIIISLSILSCTHKKTEKQLILNHIPIDSQIVIATDDLDELQEIITNSPLYQEIKNLERIEELNNKSEFLQDYKLKGKSIIAISPEGKDDIAITLITQPVDTIKFTATDYSVETYNQVTYGKLSTYKVPYYYLNHKGFHIASSSRLVIESLIRRDVKDYLFDKQFAKIYNRTSTNNLSIYINGSQKDWLQDFILKQKRSKAKIRGDWFQIEPHKTDHAFNVDGIYTYRDSLQQFHAIFNGIKAQENKAQYIIPSNINNAVMFTYSNVEQLHRQVDQYNGVSTKINSTLKMILDNSTELGQVVLPKNEALVFSLKPYEALFMNMDSATNAKFNYRDYTIYELKNPVNTTALQPLLPAANYKFITVIDEFLILSITATAPEEFIVNYQNKSVLSQQPWWNHLADNISDSSTVLYFSSLRSIQEATEEKSDTKILNQLSSDDYPFMVSQYVHEKGYAHYHALIPQADHDVKNTIVTQTGSYKSPINIIAGPFLFPNHKTGKHDIAFQDKDFVLHLVSDTGIKLWNKPLKAKILGDIKAIDGYKNSRKQMAFTTSKSVYYLDRNGKDLNNFPLQVKGEITQPLSIFDYDKNRNYRFLITHGKKLTMTDIKGKKISGFAYKTGDEIISQPRHYRKSGRDYIAFAKADNTIALLHRTGKVRTKVTDKIALKGTMSFHKNLIKMVDNDQVIYLNPTTGKITQSDIKIADTDHYTAQDGIELIQKNNVLIINGHKIELPYGTYENAQITKLYREEFIHVVETGEHQVYVLNKSGDILESFPVYGKTTSRIAQSKNRYLTTLDGDDVIIYKW